MFRNYLKYAFRRLVKSWSYTAVNMFGLAAGLVTCFLIFFYVHFESTYDRFMPDSRDKYRVALSITGEASEWRFAQTAAPFGPAFREQFPQVEQVMRFAVERNKQVAYLERVYDEDFILYSDPDFIPFFGLKLLVGDPETAISRPGMILLTESMARKYFGEENPLGKRLQIEDRTYSVTGIVPDAPGNSHIAYNFIASFDKFEQDQEMTKAKMAKASFYTYVELIEGTDPRVFEEQIQVLADPMDSPGWEYRFFLQNIRDIHLYSKLDGELKPPGDSTNLLILAVIGSFVFFIACFNFVNLSTARSLKRATEVGIRKVAGATRRQLVWQFSLESTLIVLLALAAAVGITILVFPFYRNLVGVPFSSRDIVKPVYLVFLGVLTLLAGVGAGSYPAFFMARFDPEKIIRGMLPSGAKGLGVRKALITLQFVTASLLIICALLINKQISFMKDQQNFGFQTRQRLVLRIGGKKEAIPGDRVQALKDQFARHPSIGQVSASSTVPGRGMIPESMRRQDETWNKKREIHYLGVDYDFFPQYEIGVAAGRLLDRTMPSDAAGSFLINETAAKALGWNSPEDALDQEIVLGGEQNVHRIVGVVEDFHYMGLQSPIEPLILQHYLADHARVGYFTLSVTAGGDMQETLRFVENTWAELFPGYPFDYFFLDADFKRFYAKEERLSQMIGVLTYLGIFITCLGLWGLSSLSTEQRIKEIGVRKILGASVSGIILLLSREFVRWVVAANLIAWPVGYWVVRNWLQNFAYRTKVTADIFVLSALFALAIAVVTIGLQTRKAASANPVESLRYE